ncbi:MAG TPA: Gfo/Idh/MocA family oxidoreductase [bacterium]|nr:Gfo/Idh/MocA family oxidoreductase [bacterium]HOM27483.1 Gfo/Idh/MocA family oxidoreductase [bacterium]
MIKIGFVGCGGISYRHLNDLKNMKDVKIVSAIEPNEDNFKKFQDTYGEKLNLYKDEEEMIEREKLDGVVICTPHTLHFSQIKIALQKGIDVLVEKPAVVTYEESIEIRKLIEKTGKNVVVAYQRHYMPVFNGARKIIKEKFGNIIFLSGFLAQYYYEPISTRRPWRINPQLSGKGQLTDSGSHFVALLFFLTGLTPEKVASFIDFRGEKVDMNSAFIVKFKEGAIGNFGILAFDPSFRENLFIWDDKNNVLKVSAMENSYAQFKGEKETKNIEGLEIDVKNPSEDLIKCIKKEKKTHTDWKIVENVSLLSDMVYKAYFESKVLEF